VTALCVARHTQATQNIGAYPVASVDEEIVQHVRFFA
jgi:hypothetical protein